MYNITIDISFNDSLPANECKQQMIYFIQMEPFLQKGSMLKNFKPLTYPVKPGQYRISLQYTSKEHNVDVRVSLNNTSLTERLTMGKFLYFEVTDTLNIIGGNKELFDNTMKTRRMNHQKEVKSYWNSYWVLLHTATYHYPENPSDKHKEDIRKLIDNIRNRGLACAICSAHFAAYIGGHPFEPHITSKDSLFKYFVELHNDVNRRNGKPTITLEHAKTLYIESKPTLVSGLKIDIPRLITINQLHTIPQQMNGHIRKSLKKHFKLF